MARGERAKRIREMYLNGMRPSEIAREMGITPQAVHAALRPLRKKQQAAPAQEAPQEEMAVPLE